MRTFLFGIILILLVPVVNAQPSVRAILTKNKLGYHTGDTILLKGYCPPLSSFSNKYITKSKNGNTRSISPSQIHIIDTIGDFWDKQWYYYRSGEIARKGWGNNLRNVLKSDCSNYIEDLKANGFMEEDSGLLEYLNQLVLTIGPQKLYKGFDTQLCVYVIKADQPDIFSFDNGSIFITTQLLTATKSEEELIKILTNEISHIVCDHQYTCFKIERNNNTAAAIFVGIIAVAAVAATISNDNHYDNHKHQNYHYYETQSLIIEGAINFIPPYANYAPPRINYSPPKHVFKYFTNQIFEANYITNAYSFKNYNCPEFLSQTEYTRNISPALSYTAWGLYFKSQYKESLALLNHIETANACGSDEYLLKAKLYRKLYNTEGANYEALKYLQMAREASSQTNIEILKEEGLTYYQLENMAKAKSAFEEYRYGLKQLETSGDDDKKELYWVNNMIQKTDSIDHK